MIPDELWPFIWAPAVLGLLLVLVAASAGSWPMAKRKRLGAIGTFGLLGFGLLALLVSAADAVATRDWMELTYSVGFIGLAGWIAGATEPQSTVRKLIRQAGVAVFLASNLARIWIMDGRQTALLSVGGLIAVLVLAQWALFLWKKRRPVDASNG